MRQPVQRHVEVACVTRQLGANPPFPTDVQPQPVVDGIADRLGPLLPGGVDWRASTARDELVHDRGVVRVEMPIVREDVQDGARHGDVLGPALVVLGGPV